MVEGHLIRARVQNSIGGTHHHYVDASLRSAFLL